MFFFICSSRRNLKIESVVLYLIRHILPVYFYNREKVLQEQQRERERERRAEELRLEQNRERSRSERDSASLHHDRGRVDERRYSNSPARGMYITLSIALVVQIELVN